MTTEEATLQAGLSRIRRCRWYVWLVILLYLPSIWLTLEMTQSFRSGCVTFGVWFVFLCVAVTLFAVAKCPQCGMYFHLRNSTLSFARSCRHCKLHISGHSLSETNP